MDRHYSDIPLQSINFRMSQKVVEPQISNIEELIQFFKLLMSSWTKLQQKSTTTLKQIEV